MECNKEEALRARDIAEMKMKAKEFSSARRILLKAQRLYSDLENLPQMLTICDVHCSAEHRLFGGEMDWYGILQIQLTADEAMVKKQYKKFALQLHPDKNKFPGAESAFKLIMEAQRVLSDKEKRKLHDLKRNCAMNRPTPPYRPAHWTNNSTNVGFQNNSRNNFEGMNSQRPATQQGFPNGRPSPTFWAACPHCHVKYQCPLDALDKSISCKFCFKMFLAYETSAPGAPPKANFSQPVFPKKPDVSNQGTCRVNVAHQENIGANNSKSKLSHKVSSSSEFNLQREHQPTSNQVRTKTASSEKKCGSSEFTSQNANCKKRKKRAAASSESCESDSSAETDEDIVMDNNGCTKAGVTSELHGEFPRRSSRQRQKVSYTENLSDDEDLEIQRNKDKGSDSLDASNVNEQCGPSTNHNRLRHENPERIINGATEAEDKETDGKIKNARGKDLKMHADLTSESNSDAELNPLLHNCPDAEFNDFGKLRSISCFSVNQIWAIYDNLDAMPRFYARIRKVFSPGFKLRITWLESDRIDENKIKQKDGTMPAACGKFRQGKSQTTEDHLMFSHLVCWEKGNERDSYEVLPKKGEIWAIFRNWNSKWRANANLKYEYEFVEVLTDYTGGACAWVAYLGKIKGFVSLFCRTCRDGLEKIQIPRDELFRFSHQVPSFKLTGHEREDVPKGSLELDPACLPENIEEIELPKIDIIDVDSTQADLSSGSLFKPSRSVLEQPKASNSVHEADGYEVNLDTEDDNGNTTGGYSSSPATSIEGTEVPDSEFYNFDKDKSAEMFSVGQIWSLYSDEEGLPKYYGRIEKVSNDPFEVEVKWLEPCYMSKGIRWHDKKMPISCGRFKIRKGDEATYESTESFSHQMTTVHDHKKNEYTILPEKGEIWAIYRDWSPKIKRSQLKDCNYDLVEVLEETSMGWKLSVLERVKEFKAVFRVPVKHGSVVTMEVSQAELLRFSHQVPAFRLTEQRGGSLRGCLEIDPLALPYYYFTTD